MNLVSSIVTDRREGRSLRGARHTARLETTGRLESGERIGLVVHDLSPNGMLIETAGTLSAGDRLALDALNHELPPAVVAWSSGPFRGCTFAEEIAEARVREIILSGHANMAVMQAELTEPAGKAGVASQILKFRQRRGLTTEEFASLMGVSRQAVWYWETGQRKPRGAQLRRMEEVFGLAVDRSEEGGAGFPDPSSAGRAAACIAEARTAIAAALGVDAASIRISIDL